MASLEQKILGPIGDKINTFDRLFDEYIQLREISRHLASTAIPESTDQKDADLVQIEILDKVKDLYKLWLGYVIP